MSPIVVESFPIAFDAQQAVARTWAADGEAYLQQPGDPVLDQDTVIQMRYEWARDSFVKGTTYYVAPDICAALNEAAQTVPLDARFQPEMFPYPWGFIYLPTWWAPENANVTPAGWDAQPDRGALAWNLMTNEPDGAEWDGTYSLYITRIALGTAQGGRSAIAYENEFLRDLNDPISASVEAYAVRDPITGRETEHEGMRELYTVLAFIRDSILVATRRQQSLTRQQRKHIFEVPDIYVIALRRIKPKTPTGDSADVSWSRRWLSRAHWGLRWYGTAENRTLAYTRVKGSIKGPPDKPFIPSKKTLYAVVR